MIEGNVFARAGMQPTSGEGTCNGGLRHHYLIGYRAWLGAQAALENEAALEKEALELARPTLNQPPFIRNTLETVHTPDVFNHPFQIFQAFQAPFQPSKPLSEPSEPLLLWVSSMSRVANYRQDPV